MSEYDRDFYLWAKRQGDLLRKRNFDQIDLPNLAEEVESIARQLAHELYDRMADAVRLRILLHLLPGEAWASFWKFSLRQQQRMMKRILEDAPSLREQLTTIIADALESGRLRAMEELAYAFQNRRFDEELSLMPPLRLDDLLS